MDYMTYTPEQRARALYYYFGWQGGTVHQLAAATGLTTAQILYDALTPGDHGFSAIRTCGKDWRVNKLAPTHQGNVRYWHDAIVGFWATGPLDKDAAHDC